MRLRSAKLVFAHSAWTARDRSIAAATSFGPHFGTLPSGLPVNGCSICIGSLPAVETTRADRRSSCCGVMRFDGSSTAGLGVVASAVMVDMAPILSGHGGHRAVGGACDRAVAFLVAARVRIAQPADPPRRPSAFGHLPEDEGRKLAGPRPLAAREPGERILERRRPRRLHAIRRAAAGAGE